MILVRFIDLKFLKEVAAKPQELQIDRTRCQGQGLAKAP